MDTKDDAVDYFAKLCETQGVAVATVSDGWVFSFSTKQLQSLLDASQKAGRAVVFVKRSDSLKQDQVN